MSLAYFLYFASRLPRSAWNLLLQTRARRLSRRIAWKSFVIFYYEIYSGRDVGMSPVVGALELIERLDPRRFARIERDMPKLLVRDAGNPQYWIDSEVCVLDSRTVERKSTAYLALVIVHEATHARLNHAGIMPWSRVRSRLERRCFREEQSFTRRLQHAGWGGTDAMNEVLGERIRSLKIDCN